MEACWAHNSEVGRSKLLSAISFVLGYGLTESVGGVTLADADDLGVEGMERILIDPDFLG